MKNIHTVVVLILSFSTHLFCSTLPPFTPSEKPVFLFQDVALNLARTVRDEGFEISKIMALCIGATTLYGILHDQVTVRICREYFTKGFHETNIRHWPDTGYLGAAKEILQTTTSSSVIACVWGTVATLSVGILGGILLTLASRVGGAEKYGAHNLVQPLIVSMAITGISSAIALRFPTDSRKIPAFAVQGVPRDKLPAFYKCASAHKTAYQVGALTILGTALFVVCKRLAPSHWEPTMEAHATGLSYGINF